MASGPRRGLLADRRIGGVALWMIGTLPFLTRLYLGRTSKDVLHYFDVATAVLQGQRVYVDVFFEYPPYALVWLLAPASIAADAVEFRLWFGLLVWTCDASIKAALLWVGFRAANGPPDVRPFLTYTLATAALGHILLQRYDVIPSLLCVAAALAMSRGQTALSGTLVGLAAGTKLYPLIVLPVLAAVAWRQRALGRYAAGLAVALLPLVLLSGWVPWWQFADVHVARGLQVESLWASLIWLLHFAGLPASWDLGPAWIEVTGPVADRLVNPVRVICAAATLLAAAVATGAAAVHTRRDMVMSLSDLALLMVFPLTVFVATNPVLSPQYHLWLMPFAALALRRSDPRDLSWSTRHARWGAWCLFASALLVPAFFPSPTFDAGLDLGRTSVLVLRNVLLVCAACWLALYVGAPFRRGRPRHVPMQDTAV